MNKTIHFANSTLCPLTDATVKEISTWEYEAPYTPYSYAHQVDEYLMDRSTWGTEQFCLMTDGILIGQVSCQLEGEALWVGWSMAPRLCGRGLGASFVSTCVSLLREETQHVGPMLLRVAAWNHRAIKAYQKAGFVYVETILDEIAYSGHMEDFWVMKLT